jgi:hypothetical protein
MTQYGAEHAALTQELHDLVESDRYPFSPRIPDPESDPRQAQTGARPRAVAAAEALRATTLYARTATTELKFR